MSVENPKPDYYYDYYYYYFLKCQEAERFKHAVDFTGHIQAIHTSRHVPIVHSKSDPVNNNNKFLCFVDRQLMLLRKGSLLLAG